MNETRGIGPRGENLSIMIPNYNYGHYLAATLESLKAQGEVIAAAQIQVQDNCSTDNSEEVVRAVWGERVRFHRHPENIGAIPNFQSCLDEAEKPWVHILHSDDVTLPGAYRTFDECVKAVPGAGAVFGRNVVIDAEGLWTDVSGNLGPGLRGRLQYNPMVWKQNPVAYVGALLNKEAVSKIGRFDANIYCVCDWEMWWRIAKDAAAVCYTNECVGGYRVYGGNASARLRRDGTFLRHELILLSRIADTVQSDSEFKSMGTDFLYAQLYSHMYNLCRHYLSTGDYDAYKVNVEMLSEFPDAVRDDWILARLRLRAALETSALLRRVVPKRLRLAGG